MFINPIVIKYWLVIVLCFGKCSLCQVQVSSDNNQIQPQIASFAHETCQMETLRSKEFQTFYSVDKFFNQHGVIELVVRFMGNADGHIALTMNTTDPNPRNASSYVISLGAYNNKISSIRRGHLLGFKRDTPGILSEHQYRGFVLRYNPNTGGIYVFTEGTDLPLLQLIDPKPLRINYFAFSTWDNRVIQVAFNCKAKDAYSTFAVEDPGGEETSDKKRGSYFCF